MVFRFVFAFWMVVHLTSFLPVSAQSQLLPDTLAQAMHTMAETVQSYDVYGGRYFLKGTDQPYTGILYGRYDNGELMTMQEYKNGVGNGIWIQFNPDGSLAERGTYVDNKVEGPVTLYWEDGSVKARGQYRHWRQKIGPWTYYDRAGNVVHQMIFTP